MPDPTPETIGTTGHLSFSRDLEYLGHGTPVPEAAELPSGDARVEAFDDELSVLTDAMMGLAEGWATADAAVEVLGQLHGQGYRLAASEPAGTLVDLVRRASQGDVSAAKALAASEPAAGDGLRADAVIADALNGRAMAWSEGYAKGYAAATPAPVTPTLDARPEVIAWFHESEEICEHDMVPPSCELSADHLLRAFTVEPRLTENPDGTWRFDSQHFHRLDLAARLAGEGDEEEGELTRLIATLEETEPRPATQQEVSNLSSSAATPAPVTPTLDRERFIEIVSDSLAATTEGTDWAEAPEPSDEPGSPYVLRLTNEIAARLAQSTEAAPVDPEAGR